MQFPKTMTRATFRLRLLAVAQALVLLVSLGVPIAATASIGAQAPSPAAAVSRAAHTDATQVAAITADATAGTGTKLVITSISPTSPTIGVGFDVTVQVQDGSDNPADVTAGTDVTLSRHTGTGTLGGTLAGTIAINTHSVTISGVTYSVAEAGVVLTATKTSGPGSLTAGNSAAFTVSPVSSATKLAITSISPTSPTAGTGFSVTVESQDASSGTANVTSDTGLTLSLHTGTGTLGGTVTGTILNGAHSVTISGVTYTKAEAGVILTATRTSGNTLTAGDSAAFTVVAGAFTKLQLLVPGETAAPGTTTGKTGTPSPQTAGSALTVTVNAVDANWNLVSSTDTVRITSSDSGATLPADHALAAGTHTFSVTLTAGTRTVTATDVTDGTKTANTSPSITVVAAASSGTGTMTVSPTSVVAASISNSLVFTFTAPASSGFASGSYVTLTVPSGWTAPTTSNTAVANATGVSCNPSRSVSGSGPWVITITQTCANSNSFTLTYSGVTAPAAAGLVTFAATSRSGSGSNLALTTSPIVTVAAGAFTKLQILVPGETAAPGTASGKTGTPTTEGAGAAFNVIVNAVDANWNLVSSTHTVAITSSDAAATLPASAALVAGTKTFSVTLRTVGTKTVTATDVSDATKTANTSPSITVVTPAVISLVRSTGMVAYGGPVSFSIQFTSLGASRTVYLEHTYVGSSWTTVATQTTNASGFASVSYTPSRSGYYRARFAGAADLGAAYSSVVLVGVRQTVTLLPTHTDVMAITKGRTITFRATIAPLRPDLLASRATFRFYQKVAGAWVLKYERHVAADTAGTARTTFTFGVRGSWYVMAYADRTPYNAVSRFSQREVFLVR
jgi:hypothetical protein